MTSRAAWTKRFPLWVAVFALLLKSAMPMLASASAGWQGKTLVEVCTVYGIATIALDGEASSPLPDATSHAGEHCALNALVAAGPAGEPLGGFAPPARHAPRLLIPLHAPPPDAVARWAAQLRHAPPPLA